MNADDLDDQALDALALRNAVTIRPVTCPECGLPWVAPISQEDINDGVGDEVLCLICLGKVLGLEE